MDVRIERHECHYHVPPAHPSADEVRRRLDRVARGLLSHAWDHALNETPESEDPLYFVERVDVDLTLDLSADDRALARAWSLALHRGLRRALVERRGCIVFRNRGEYLASFIEDLLVGRTGECWYYRAIDLPPGLAVGPAAARALIDAGDAGRDALIELARRGVLERLLAQLDDAGIEAVVAHCILPPSPRLVLANTIARWTAALRELLASGRVPITNNAARDVARLYLYLLRDHPELGPDVHLARFIDDLCRLVERIRTLDEPAQIELLARVESAEWHRVIGWIGSGPARTVVLTLEHEIGGPAAAALLRELAGAAREPATTRVRSRFGGVFLLIPGIVDLGIADFLSACPYPQPRRLPKAHLLLYLIGRQALGREHAAAVAGDAAVALFAGLTAVPTDREIADYAATIAPEAHAAFEERFEVERGNMAARWPVPVPASGLAKDGPDEWLLPGPEPSLPRLNLERALAAVSGTVVRAFAARLGAFADSSPGYLARNFLESEAEIEVSAKLVLVRFLTSPLQIVLRMAGFDGMNRLIPWLDGRRLEFQFT